MKTGTLIPQRGTDRLDIRFDLYDYHGGLHCGETLDVKISGRWVPNTVRFTFRQNSMPWTSCPIQFETSD